MIKFEKLPADILSRIPCVKDELLNDGNVLFAYIFGGLARGKIAPLSDADMAVYVNNTSGLAEYKTGLFYRITDILGTNELDLVVLNTASISIAGRILQSRTLLVDKVPFFRHSYESLTMREFFDFKMKEDAFFRRRYGIG